MKASAKYAALLGGVLLVFFGGIAALWMSGRTDLYFAVMHDLRVDAFSRPFLDLTGLLSMGECHRMGIDVTRINPCDPLHRLLPYGPLVLYEPFATPETILLGLVQSLLFLAAIPLVLRPRTPVEFLAAAAASLSCGVLYALERGNFDLIEFLLIALAIFLGARGFAGRLGAYLLFYAGGTLKFYPFALLVMIAREKLAVAIGLAALGLAAIAGYGFVYRDMLAQIGAAMPSFEYNTDVFGAACLPFGLADWLGFPAMAGGALMVLLVAVFGLVAWRIACRLQRALGAADFETINFQLLVAGTVVLAGCFFLGTSISYRSIFLLLLLPGLFDLTRKAELAHLAAAAIGIAIFCLWGDFFRQWGEAAIDHLLDLVAPDRGDNFFGDLPSMVFFAGRELLWWWLAALLSGIVAVFLFNARALQEILQTITKSPDRLHGPLQD